MTRAYLGQAGNKGRLLRRIVITAAAAVVILSYGVAYQLAVETFIGGLLAIYTGYGVWLARFGYKQLQYAIVLDSPTHAPFYTNLCWQQHLSYEGGLPRLFLQVITTWERADQDTSDSPDHYESVKVIHSRGRAEQAWAEQLDQAPAGIYRHLHTRCITGDIWGWFTKEWIWKGVTIQQSSSHEVIVLPEAKQWKMTGEQLPRASAEEGSTSSSYTHTREAGQLSPELRAYQQGDDARAVHWRHYAKTRQMAVRIKLPESADMITLIVDDVIHPDLQDAGLCTKLQADLRTIAAEWLWRAWQQGLRVQVRWMSDGMCITHHEDIARELVRRGNRLDSKILPASASVTRTFQAATELPVVRDAVLISIADQEDALERVRQQMRGCRLHSWLTVQHHGSL